MTSQVGLGTGIIFLITLWILTSIITVVSFRTEKIIGITAIIIVSIVTIFIFTLPVDTERKVVVEQKVRKCLKNYLGVNHFFSRNEMKLSYGVLY